MAGKFYPCIKKDRVYYMSALQPPAGPCPDPGQKPGGLENMDPPLPENFPSEGRRMHPNCMRRAEENEIT